MFYGDRVLWVRELSVFDPLQHTKGVGQLGTGQGFDLLAVGDVEHLPQPEAGDEPGDVVGVARSGPV